MRTYPVVVKEVRHEAADSTAYWLDLPAEYEDTFSYLPGQYIMLIIPEFGVRYARNYSMITNPYTDKGELAFCTKKVPNGKISTYINEKLKVGDTVELLPPGGEFTIDPKEAGESKNLFFAGGSGFTPILSMIKSLSTEFP
jgi:ring-1,2-phenylacetyl-CoA epoxidase subunit PaaE